MEKSLRVNQMIRVPEVRLVDAEGKQLGIFPIEEALRIAEEEGLDLVEVAPHAKPPVCKIMDYGRFRYQQSKRVQEARKKQKLIQVKEVKMRPKTEEHDYQFKVKHIRRFLSEGNKVKVTIMFRGREMDHTERGREILERVAGDMEDIGVVEQTAKQEGRNMTMVLTPKSL
ncbi:MAG: translation initiation factor IF-3 [Nitrospinota bacterium]|nr:MAG: translation initiation factor IF-3 [Nitrospinota bacterium]